MRFGRLVSHRTLKLCPQVADPGSTLSRLFVRNSVSSVFSVVSMLVPMALRKASARLAPFGIGPRAICAPLDSAGHVATT